MKSHRITTRVRKLKHDNENDRATAPSDDGEEQTDEPVTERPAAGSHRAGSRRAHRKRDRPRPQVESSEDSDRPPLKRDRRTRRRRRIVAASAVLSILLGCGIAVGSIFFDSVDLPSEMDARLNQNSTVYYSDGKTVMGTLGTENRKSVSLASVPDHLEWALIAAEDQEFYEHSGVDFWGVMRAFWNNVKGGSQQGASTLTQQYVGQMADIRGDGSYMRKAREAVMAMKMDSDYSKKEILAHYLNLVYFGRGAYGVDAAARAFFGKPVKELDLAQSALLVTQIKSPDGSTDPRDPLGLGAGKVRQAALDRWSYVLDQMVVIGHLSAKKRAELTELPTTIDPNKQVGAGASADTPTGFVSNKYVMQELHAAGFETDEVLRGGFRITTTINADLQDELASNSVLQKIVDDDEIDAGLTAIEPDTGNIVAYYGGENGVGVDAAGSDLMHPPGTSANIVPAIAALDSGASLQSRWDASSPRKFDSRLNKDGKPEPLLNTGGANDPNVSLAEAVQDKLDTPIYAVAEQVGVTAMAKTAAGLGITQVGVPGETGDKALAQLPGDTDDLDFSMGLGVNPISVTESAAMYATVANHGDRVTPHFVASATVDGDAVFEAKPETTEGIAADIAADITNALVGSEPPATGGDPTFGHETEAPRLARMAATNASSTWYCGFVPQLSVSVWAGDDKHEGDGSSPEDTEAQHLWTSFMDKAYEEYPESSDFDPPVGVGNDGGGELPADS